MEKRNRVTFTSNDNSASSDANKRSRSEIFKLVAKKRASHFARAGNDASSTVSSTPTGIVTPISSSGKEQWPGPFSTARQIIAKREEAKKLRDEEIQKGKENTKWQDSHEVEKDEYEQHASGFKWELVNNHVVIKKPYRLRNSGAIASLVDICIKTVTMRFDEMDTYDMLSADIRKKMAIELSKKRMLSAERALKLCSYLSDSIYFPECSEIDDISLKKAMQMTVHEEVGIEDESLQGDDRGNLRMIQLKNCGHAMTDSIADYISKHVPSLEILELAGCYKLTDFGLIKIILAGKSTLRSLSMACNSRIGRDGLASICSNLHLLEELVLDHANHLCDGDLLCLVQSMEEPLDGLVGDAAKGLDKLNHLSLFGLTEITDDSVTLLLKTYGRQLQHLNIGHCVRLTDRSIMSIRSECDSLQYLNLSDLISLTTTALIGLFVVQYNEEEKLGNFSHVFNPDAIDQADDDADDPTKVDEEEPIGANADEMNATNMPFSIGPLHSVNLQGSIQTNDDVLIHICELSKHHLRCLNISGCYRITNKGLAALDIHCRDSMEELDISYIRNISEDMLGYLVDSFSNETFQKLSVWGCSQLTARFFEGHRKNDLLVYGRMDAALISNP